MILRSKQVVFFLIFSLLTSVSFGGDFRFSGQIKGKFLEKVLNDYPMLDKNNVTVSIQSEPYLAGLVGDCKSFSLTFPDKSDVMGRTVTPVLFFDEKGNMKQKINMVVDVDAEATFIRVRSPLKRYSILTSQNTEAVVLPYKGYNKGHLLAKNSYEGKQVLSTMSEGTVLATWMYDDALLIRSGDRVRVLMQKPGYELDIKGVAEENGKKGQKIRVRMDLNTHKTLQCEVVNETTVRYQNLY